MRKRNRNSVRTPRDGYIKTYFKNDIDLLLTPSNRAVFTIGSPYVPHERAETFLRDYLRPDERMDRIALFTGLVGAGKTTIIRNFFHFGITEAVKPWIDEQHHTIMIPIDFNRFYGSAHEAILGNLRKAMEIICERYNVKAPVSDNEEFYEYVDSRRPDLLRANDDWLTKTHAQRLATIGKDNDKLLDSCRFQYVMDQALELNHVLLIIDDIEAFDSPIDVINDAFKLAECFRHRGERTRFMFDMIICCRHHVWRLMNERNIDGDPEKPRLQSYFTTTDFDLNDPVSIQSIVDRRQEVFGVGQKDINQWEIAVQVVRDILFQADFKIGELVHQLELKNTRTSFATLKELVQNYGLQRESQINSSPGAFRINSVEEFDISRVNLIRQYGLNYYDYYVNTNSIPNLLYNLPASERDIEMYPLLTMKYFLRMCNYEEPDWQVGYQISHFKRRMEYIFGYTESVFDETFGRSVRYLIKKRLLLRSKDQDQTDTKQLEDEAAQRKVELVYVSGAAVSLWKELAASSALFQLFIDDVWLPRNSDFFGKDGNDIEHCVKYLIHLWEKERRIFNQSRDWGHVKDYCELFGRKPVSLQLLLGLKNSLQKILESTDSWNSVRKRSALETMLRVEDLEREMSDWSDTY